LHPLGDGVGAPPDADVAVVGLAVVGEARPEQRPVPLVDACRIPHEHLRDVLTDVTVQVAHSVPPMTPPPAYSIITLTASLRDIEPSCWAAARHASPTNHVGPLDRMAMA